MKTAIKALVVMNILSMIYQFEHKLKLKEFQCDDKKTSLALNLKDDDLLKNSNSFSISFWMNFIDD